MRTLRLLLMVSTAFSAVEAQDRLSVGTHVRLALPQGEMIEGRVAGGDDTSLRVRVQGLGMMVVPRERILLITASAGGGNRALFTGIISGGLGALSLGAATTSCNSRQSCGPDRGLTVGAGALGAPIGAIIAGGVQRMDWRAIETSAPVAGNSFDVDGPEPCLFKPTIQARAGLSSAGSRTGAAALSLFCHRGVTIGAEAGLLRDLEMPVVRTFESQVSNSYYYDYVTIEHEETRSASFAGGFGEWAVPGPMNPRIIISGGGYRRRDAVRTTTYGYAYNAYGTQAIATQSLTSFHPGMGAGISFSVPAGRNVSLGFGGRTHFLLGNFGGTISTIEATLRLRP